MFCIHCGAQLKDGTRFCTKCGKSTQEGEAILAQQASRTQQAATQVAMQTPQVQQTPPVVTQAPASSVALNTNYAKPKSNTAIIIVVALIAVAAIAAAVFFFLMPALTSGNGSSNASSSAAAIVGDSSSAASASSDAISGSADSSSQSANQGSGSSSGEASSDSAESPSSETSETTNSSFLGDMPDEAGLVSDQQRYSAMNLFLSNFSEVGFESMSSVSSVKPAELVRFALSHDAINSPEYWESTTDQPSNPYNIKPTNREAMARIDELVSRYMGTSVNYSNIAPPFIHMGGYVYFNKDDVVQSPWGITAVTGSENAGTNLIKVHFAVISGGYNPTDKSLYSLSAEDLMNRLNKARLAYTGTAVVRTGGNNEITGGLTLVSIEKDR